jgi:uncharacterized LabA/DUF88 family protein
MAKQPKLKRAIAFFDGSNVRFAAREAFGEEITNCNPLALATDVCAQEGWALQDVHYYLGVPDVRVTEDGHYAWMKRCARWRKQGVKVFTRPLQHDDDGGAREKGVDVRLALDVINLHHKQAFDVAIIFSQDQDFSEVAAEVKAIARDQNRWIQVVSAYPNSEQSTNQIGVLGARHLPLSFGLYERCLDTSENRKMKFAAPAFEAPTLTPIAEAVSSAASAPASKRSKRPGALTTLLANIYLAATIGTFGFLTWVSLPLPEAGLEIFYSAITNWAQSLLWPAFWWSALF